LCSHLLLQIVNDSPVVAGDTLRLVFVAAYLADKRIVWKVAVANVNGGVAPRFFAAAKAV
jgi:hypothetical protein